MKKLLDPDEMPQWLSRFFAQLNPAADCIAGIDDDDCAVIRLGGTYLVITMDFLNSNPIAVELGIGNAKDLGRLLVASNLSDLYGTGAKPVALLVGITLPRDASEEEFRQIMAGVRAECAIHSINVIGGDTKLGPARSLVAVGIGEIQSEQELFLKSRAQAGDILWASGILGSAAAAVAGLSSGRISGAMEKLAKNALLCPHLPIERSRRVALAALGRGGTDISDGLGADLHDLARASGIGLRLHVERIPCCPLARHVGSLLDIPPWTFALVSGGDFQFVVTTSVDDRSFMTDLGFTEIGSLTSERQVVAVFPDGSNKTLPSVGHRDRRQRSFRQEVKKLLQAVNQQFRDDKCPKSSRG